MNYDLSVLRALVRIVRAAGHADTEALAVRAGGSHAEVRAAVARLVTAGLVLRTPRRLAPTLEGLCIAVSSAAARRPRAVAKKRTSPAARRHAA